MTTYPPSSELEAGFQQYDNYCSTVLEVGEAGRGPCRLSALLLIIQYKRQGLECGADWTSNLRSLAIGPLIRLVANTLGASRCQRRYAVRHL